LLILKEIEILAWINAVSSHPYTNTVTDTVLEKTRYSKLGAAIKAPSVEEPKPKEKKASTETPANRDYKLV